MYSLYINNNMLLCIVDYYSNFPIMKKADHLSAEDLIRVAKIVFTVLITKENNFRCMCEFWIRPGLPSPVTPMFNRPIRPLLPQTNREPININADKENNQALKTGQDKYLKENEIARTCFLFL